MNKNNTLKIWFFKKIKWKWKFKDYVMDVSVSQSRKNTKNCDNVIGSFTRNINSLNAWKYNHELLIVYSFQHSLFIYLY